MLERQHGGQRPEEWIGALVTFPSYVTGEGEPYRPTAVMWVDTESGAIIDSELVPPDQALARAAGLFIHATREPKAGPPRVPQRLRVSDDALATVLRGSIGDVDVVVAPTPEIDEVVAAMTAHFSDPDRSDGESVTYLGPDVTAEDVAAMFAAAARMFRVAPWDAIPGDVCLGVSCDRLHLEEGAMVVVGQMKQAYGFSLFTTPEDAVDFYAAVEARDEGGEENVELPPHLMFGFEAKSELPEQLLAEIEEHGWEVASAEAYPSPLMVDSDLVVRGLTRSELVGVTAIMTALADMVEGEPDLASAWEDEDSEITWNRTVSTALGDVTVELRAPLDLPTDNSAAGYDSIVDEDGEVDEDVLEDFAAALIDVMTGVPDVEEIHLRAADLLIQQAAMHFALPLTYVSREQLEQLLFQIIPAKVAVEPEIASGLIDAARLVMLFAAHKLEVEPAKDIAAWLAEPALVKELTTALSDERRYSPTKAMILEGLREGFDLSTEEGVGEWVEILNERAEKLAKKSAKKPAAKAAAAKAPAKKAAAKAPAKKAAAKAPTKSAKATPAKAKAAAKAKPATKSKAAASKKTSGKGRPARSR